MWLAILARAAGAAGCGVRPRADAIHGPGEAVGSEEAHRLQTRAPVYFSFEEDQKGAIAAAAGRLAVLIASRPILPEHATRPDAISG